MLVTCAQCMTTFNKKPNKVRVSEFHFCERLCWQEWNRRHPTRKPIAISERFWKKVDVRGEDDCWLWMGAVNSEGYGNVGIGKTTHRAHRIAYELAYEKPSMNVLHSCDTPLCCNPRHLRNGSQASNIQEAVERGRVPNRWRPAPAFRL